MSGIKANALNSDQAQQILTEVKSRIQLSIQSPTRLLPGQPFVASIIPNVPQIDVSELVNGVINLAWLEKDVLFNTVNAVTVPTTDSVTDPNSLNGDQILTNLETANATNVKGQPFPPLPPSLNSISGIVPGLASQLAGTITLPKLSVNIAVEWIIKDNAGNRLFDGQDLIALNGLTNPSLSILLPPIFRELRKDTVGHLFPSIYCLSVKVTVSIGSATLPVMLGPVPIFQLPILIPTVVALFSEPNFSLERDSSVLILVPKHSVFSSAAPLFQELKKIENILDTLGSIASVAGFLLGLSELTDLFEHPRLRFVSANGVPNLHDILLKSKSWYDILGDDDTYNDITSSLFVFGLPGTAVSFYNRTKFEEDDGFYEIRLKNSIDLQQHPDVTTPLPDFFVAIRSFPTSTEIEMDPTLNTAAPETFPAGRIKQEYDDPNSPNRWDNVLSSVRFSQSWLDEVDREINTRHVILRPCIDLHDKGPLPTENK